MKPEQRLLLALTLTLGIILTWSLFSPPEKTPFKISQHSDIKNVIAQKASPEPKDEFRLDSARLEIGAERGGIQSLRVDDLDLLMDANPGFLQPELIHPSEKPLKFENRSQEESIFSTAGSLESGIQITREIARHDVAHNYLLICKLQIKNRSSQTKNCQIRVVTYCPVHLATPAEQSYRYAMVTVDGKNRAIPWRPGQEQRFSGSPVWMVSQGKSYGLVVQPEKPVGTFHVEHPSGGSPTGWLTLPAVELGPGQSQAWIFKLYAGPLSLKNLREVGLEEAVSFGAFSGIAKILFRLLSWSHGWLKNYGLAIVFLGSSIWILFLPITWSGIRMTQMMGKLQPQVERIKREHGKDPQRMNREMLELYKKHRVNPISGCLPLFLQMPIFVALFQVLSRSPELRGAQFLWIRDLSGPDALVHFPSEVPLIGHNLNLLPILMAASMFLQQRMSQPVSTGLSEEQAVQQKMFRWFPLFFAFLFYNLPSGLVLYWVTNTLLTLGQYLFYARLHRE